MWVFTRETEKGRRAQEYKKQEVQIIVSAIFPH